MMAYIDTLGRVCSLIYHETQTGTHTDAHKRTYRQIQDAYTHDCIYIDTSGRACSQIYHANTHRYTYRHAHANIQTDTLTDTHIDTYGRE